MGNYSNLNKFAQDVWAAKTKEEKRDIIYKMIDNYEVKVKNGIDLVKQHKREAAIMTSSAMDMFAANIVNERVIK